MKRMNRSLIAGITATTLLLSGAVAFAAGNDQQRDPSQRFDYIFTQLDLSDDQRTAVIDVMEAAMEEHRDLMWQTMQSLREQDERPSREDMQALMTSQQAAMTQSLTDDLNTVLSPEVTAELIEYIEAHRGMGAMGRHGGRGDHGGMGFQGGGFGKRN